MGIFVLLIGDTNIPSRKSHLPQQFKEVLLQGKMQYVLCTGNVSNRETVDYMKSLCQQPSNVYFAKGDFDEDLQQTEEFHVVKVGNYKIGLIHGHQVVPWGDKRALLEYTRKLDCDVLVSGHTHELGCYEFGNKLFVNPGSATGAFSGLKSNPTPSFIVLDVNKDTIMNFLYTIENDKLKVKKFPYPSKK